MRSVLPALVLSLVLVGSGRARVLVRVGDPRRVGELEGDRGT